MGVGHGEIGARDGWNRFHRWVDNSEIDRAGLSSAHDRARSRPRNCVARRCRLVFLVVYVDDLLLAATTRKFMDSIKAKLSASFKMQDLGEAKYILGIEIVTISLFFVIARLLTRSFIGLTLHHPARMSYA